MKTLIIWDNEGNVVFSKKDENLKESDFNVSLIHVPENNILVGVNAETGEPLFEDLPKSETDLLKEALTEMSLLIAKQQEQLDSLGGI